MRECVSIYALVQSVDKFSKREREREKEKKQYFTDIALVIVMVITNNHTAGRNEKKNVTEHIEWDEEKSPAKINGE